MAMLRASQGHEHRRNACWLFIKSRPKTGKTACCFNRTKKTYPRHGIQDSCLHQIRSLIWERRGRSSLLAEAIFDNTAKDVARGLHSVSRYRGEELLQFQVRVADGEDVRVAACEEVMEGIARTLSNILPKDAGCGKDATGI